MISIGCYYLVSEILHPKLYGFTSQDCSTNLSQVFFRVFTALEKNKTKNVLKWGLGLNTKRKGSGSILQNFSTLVLALGTSQFKLFSLRGPHWRLLIQPPRQLSVLPLAVFQNMPDRMHKICSQKVLKQFRTNKCYNY